MNDTEQQALAAICLMAAFADGEKSDAERAKMKEVFDGLGGVAPGVYQRVLLKQTSVDREVAALASPETRNLAYELAVCVCDADGLTSAPERAFLDDLRGRLDLDGGDSDATLQQAEQVAMAEPAAPVEETAPATAATPGAAATALGGAGVAGGALAATSAQPPAAPVPAQPDPSAQVDGTITKYAILCGALELLPQSLATMAIIPVQMKLVYAVGRQYGVNLDSGHIKEFIGVVGVGMTSQVVENFARNLIGGFAKKALGKKMGKGFGKVGKSAAGAAITFATTYALGQVAKQYYAGGRTLSAVDLKSLFSRNVEQARGIYQQYAPQVQQQANSLSMTDVTQLMRGRV